MSEEVLLGPSNAAAAFGASWFGYTIGEWQEEMNPQDYSRARMALRVLLVGGLIGLVIVTYP